MTYYSLAMGIVCAAFSLGANGEAPEGIRLSPERTPLAQKFAQLATEAQREERLAVMADLLATYPTVAQNTRNPHSSMSTPDDNDRLLAILCREAERLERSLAPSTNATAAITKANAVCGAPRKPI